MGGVATDGSLMQQQAFRNVAVFDPDRFSQHDFWTTAAAELCLQHALGGSIFVEQQQGIAATMIGLVTTANRARAIKVDLIVFMTRQL